jgi:hypothetical protein
MRYTFKGDGYTGIHYNDANSFSFYTNNTERIQLQDDTVVAIPGQLAIGQTSASCTLDVSGAINCKGSSYGSDDTGSLMFEHGANEASSIIFKNTASTQDYGFIRYVDSYSDFASLDTSFNIRYRDVSSSIFGNGNGASVLYIGTETHESDSIRDNILIRPSGVLTLDTGGSSDKIGENNIILFPGSTYSGNVGIKTANPGYDLDVSGDIRCTGDLYVGDAIRFVSDTAHNTGIFWNSENNFSLKTDNNARLTVNDAEVNIPGILTVTGYAYAASFNATGNSTFGSANTNVHKIQGQLEFYDGSRNDFGRIYYDESTPESGKFIFEQNDDGTEEFIFQTQRYRSGSPPVEPSPVERFKINSTGISTSGSATAASFNATSDYRVKENVQTISGDNYTVDHLRPVSYTLKDSQEPHIGFIAHELQEHVPTAVKGEKDGEKMQSVNYSELIPILVKEIQDLKQKVSSLESEVDLLRNPPVTL